MDKKAKKILFRMDLTRKILEGMKTQTRRMVKESDKGKPRYNVGDILWVPETFAQDGSGRIHYRIDEPEVTGIHWKASLFMPIRYARIWLEVTDVKKQSVQDITEDDAIEEGCDPHWREITYLLARDEFAAVFDECYGEGAWDRNPLVWAITFKRIKPPIKMLMFRDK